MQPTFGNLRLSEITSLAIERYKGQRKQDGVSEVTINRELAFLKNLFMKAMEWGHAADNPVKPVKFYREDNGRVRVLTEEEEMQLLVCCPPQLRPLVVTALHTGFRASELLSLTWTDVDFRRQRVTVQAAYAKNGESRSVPMNAVVRTTLWTLQQQGSGGSRVFCTRQGTPYRSFHQTFITAVRKARLADVTFHDLRHTFASRLVMAGVDLATVKELLGHKHLAMTLRYTHLSSDHKQAAVQALEPVGEKVPTIFTTGASLPLQDVVTNH
jgi:integrase